VMDLASWPSGFLWVVTFINFGGVDPKSIFSNLPVSQNCVKWCLHRRENITCCCCCQRWRFEKMGGFLLKSHRSAKSLVPTACVNKPLLAHLLKTIYFCFQFCQRWETVDGAASKATKAGCGGPSQPRSYTGTNPIRLFSMPLDLRQNKLVRL
jgi:hypothetical protein